MKTNLKLIAFLLAMLISLTSFVACNNDGNQETNDGQGNGSEVTLEDSQASETETEMLLEVEKNNYASDFYLSVQGGSNHAQYCWVEESSNDLMTQAVYTRQQNLLEYLGVTLVARGAGDHMTYTNAFTTAVKNKDGSVDTLLTHVYKGVSGLLGEGYIVDLKDYPGINIDADYWNTDFMESIAVADGYYYGNSDYNLLSTYVITFNKGMMEKYSNVITKNVYDMVRDYEWTLDQMIALAQLVYVDVTADGKTEDDIFGIAGRQWNEFPGFFHASDINIIEPDESGEYKLSAMNEKYSAKSSTVISKLYELAKSNYSWFDYQTTSMDTVPIYSDRTLLHLNPTGELPILCEYDFSFGVLPYPMYDTLQKDVGYRHLQWGGYICVPSYVNNPQMVGETLDVLAYYSKDVNTAYYEKLLGKQAADAPDDKHMLEIVWDSICTDFAHVYADMCGSEIVYMVAHLTYAEATDNIASYVAGRERTINNTISKFIARVQKRNNR